MTRRRGLGEPLETIVRVVVGLGILVVGLTRALEPHNYPPGDFRNEPITWVIVGILAVVLGGAGLLSVFWPRLRQ